MATYLFSEPSVASVQVVESAASTLLVSEAQPCIVTIEDGGIPQITLQHPAASLVTVQQAAAASLTITPPAAAPPIIIQELGGVATPFAQRDYLGATPTYINGVLTRIDYTDATARLFTYYPSGLLKWLDYLAPNRATLRKTITWGADGSWGSTSGPVEVI